ncbi:hypothetical protein [Serratia marcescens]|uniref:hypothetical protein n=1 Tax=Serratia marcescens TaxID=615 RepID=UPI0011B48ABF|nr:hypothetical protein [Serratia marcescens]MDS0828862.1 hypothetical protein [Serratia marcescens]
MSKISDYAAQVAMRGGEFLMAGDATYQYSIGDVIPVTERCGLRVVRVGVIPVIDAPLTLLMALCERVKGGFRPIYSVVVYETAQQAALAQMLNDAGEGFDVDDLVDIQSLDAQVSIIRVEQVANYEHKFSSV